MTQGLLPIKLEKSDDAITPHAGLMLVHECIQAYGLIEAFKNKMPQPKSNRGFSPQTFIGPILLSMAGGGRTIEDVQKIFNDTPLSQILHLKSFDSDTLDKWLKRSAKTKTTHLKKIHRQFIKRLISESDNQDFTADFDAMAIEANKSTAEKTYKGFRGYMPMLGFLREIPVNVFSKFQTGNTSPATGICDAIDDVASLMPKGKRLAAIRSDSAGYQSRIIDYCQDHNIIYTITADFDKSVKAAITSISEDDWKVLLDDKGKETDREYAETIHTMNKSNHSFRLIIQRHKTIQYNLFSDGKQRHYTFITNDERRSAQELIPWHNGRGQAENLNKEVKYGVNLDYLPTNNFNANQLWFQLGLLAYNIFQAIKLFALPEHWRKKKIATLRWQLFQIAGKFVFHGNQFYLKLCSISDNIFRLFSSCRLLLYQIAAT